MLLHHVAERAARRWPGSPALHWGDETIGFGDLWRRIQHRAAHLSSLVGPGDRVAVLADNCPAYVEAYYAVPLAGGAMVPLNQRLHEAEWSDQIARSDASVLVADPALLDRTEIRPGTRVVPLDEWGGWSAPADGTCATPATDAAEPDDADPAWLLFTSGTTGAPKGAVLTHRSLLAAVAGTAIGRPVAADDVYCFPFPLCHVAGYNVVHHHLHGRPVVLLTRFTVEGVIGAVDHHGVTSISLAPTMLAMLLTEERFDRHHLPTLRTIGYGASAMPEPVLRATLDRFDVEMAQGYGMTELSGNAVFLDGEGHRRAIDDRPDLLTAAGAPTALADLRIVDDVGDDVTPGEPGEVVVRGDQVFAGYWDDPDATESAFLPGRWFRTGDVGRIDDDGLLHVVDRKKDMIVTGGENVASREVEDVIRSLPGVADVAVVGVPHPRWGEQVCAVVVADPNDAESFDVAAVTDGVRARLAGFKVPRRVEVVASLPTNHSGKVLKAALRARFADGG